MLHKSICTDCCDRQQETALFEEKKQFFFKGTLLRQWGASPKRIRFNVALYRADVYKNEYCTDHPAQIL